MVNMDDVPDSLTITYICFAWLADIIFLWLLHLTSIRLPRPHSNGKWNKTQQNECTRCICSAFTPQYSDFFFATANKGAKSKSPLDRKLVPLSATLLQGTYTYTTSNVYTLLQGTPTIEETKHTVKEETKQEEEEQTTTSVNVSYNRITDDADSEVHQFKIHPRHKPFFCFYLSFLWRIWNAICGLLALVISAGFWFNIILEYMIRCCAYFLLLGEGYSVSVFGFIALYFMMSIPMWFGKQCLHAFWIMFICTADKHRMLFVEWYRIFHLLWCILCTFIWAVQHEETNLMDVVFWQNFSRWMLMHGVVYFAAYCFFIVMLNIWITVNVLHLSLINTFERFIDDYLNPYTWILCSGNDTFKLEQYIVKRFNIFQRQNPVQSLTVKDLLKYLLFGININVDNKNRQYFKYVFISILWITMLFCWIYAAVQEDSFTAFTGYGILCYYILIIFIRRNDNNVAFKLWNGIHYTEFFNKLCDMSSRRWFPDDESDVQIITMNFMDYWSIIYYEQQRNDFCPCCCINEATQVEEREHLFNEDGSRKKCSCLRALCDSRFLLAVISICVSISFLAVFLVFATIIAKQQYYDSSDTNPERHDINNIGKDLYPMCYELHFAEYLSAADLIWLTSTAYYTYNKRELFEHIKYWFSPNNTDYSEYELRNATGWDIQNAYVYWDDSEYVTTFFHIENIKYDFDVIGVRGTHTLHDAIQDASLFSEIFVIQSLSKIVPIIGIFPDTFIRDLVSICSRPAGIIYPAVRERYDIPIYEYITKNLSSSLSKEANSKRFVFIVGHSLGGGVAQMVASTLYDEGYRNVFSFGVSSPGVAYSSKKFEISLQSLDFSAISLLPRRDPVALIDKHQGYIQSIECDAAQFVSCHGITRTFCEIYQACGPQYMRNISFTDCVCFQSKEDDPWDACNGS